MKSNRFVGRYASPLPPHAFEFLPITQRSYQRKRVLCINRRGKVFLRDATSPCLSRSGQYYRSDDRSLIKHELRMTNRRLCRIRTTTCERERYCKLPICTRQWIRWVWQLNRWLNWNAHARDKKVIQRRTLNFYLTSSFFGSALFHCACCISSEFIFLSL